PRREDPAAPALRLLGPVPCAAPGAEQLEPRPQPVVEPDRPLRAGDLVPQVHAAPEGPAHLELSEGSALVAHQPHGVILGLDRVDLCVTPAGDLEWAHVAADEARR